MSAETLLNMWWIGAFIALAITWGIPIGVRLEGKANPFTDSQEAVEYYGKSFVMCAVWPAMIPIAIFGLAFLGIYKASTALMRKVFGLES